MDTHHHLWDLDSLPYEWLVGDGAPDEMDYLGDYASIRSNYLIEDLLADYGPQNVVKSVHVQADFSGPDPTVETRWLQAIADSHGYPHGIVAHTDFRSPDAGEELDRHCESPNMRGIRMMAHDHLLDEPDFRRGVAELAKRGLSFDLTGESERADAGLRLAPFVPGHLDHPHPYRASLRKNRRVLPALAVRDEDLRRAPNMVVKISGLGMRDRNWTVDSIRPWILETIEIFGVDRCMFGTNWPVDRLYSDFDTLLGAFRQVIAGFSPTSRPSSSPGTPSTTTASERSGPVRSCGWVTCGTPSRRCESVHRRDTSSGHTAVR